MAELDEGVEKRGMEVSGSETHLSVHPKRDRGDCIEKYTAFAWLEVKRYWWLLRFVSANRQRCAGVVATPRNSFACKGRLLG